MYVIGPCYSNAMCHNGLECDLFVHVWLVLYYICSSMSDLFQMSFVRPLETCTPESESCGTLSFYLVDGDRGALRLIVNSAVYKYWVYIWLECCCDRQWSEVPVMWNTECIVDWSVAMTDSGWSSWHPGVSMAETTAPLSDNIETLGVTLDSHLILNSHISTVCKSAFYYTWGLRHIWKSLIDDMA